MAMGRNKIVCFVSQWLQSEINKVWEKYLGCRDFWDNSDCYFVSKVKLTRVSVLNKLHIGLLLISWIKLLYLVGASLLSLCMCELCLLQFLLIAGYFRAECTSQRAIGFCRDLVPLNSPTGLLLVIWVNFEA